MSRIIQLGIALLTLLLFILTRPAPSVLACSPLPGYPNYTVTDRTNAADVVLEGVVIDVMKNEWFEQTATVEVTQYFKNNDSSNREPNVVTIKGFGSPAMCLAWVQVEDHLIFYSKGNATDGLAANYLEPHDAVASPTPEVISEIMAALQLKRYFYFPLMAN